MKRTFSACITVVGVLTSGCFTVVEKDEQEGDVDTTQDTLLESNALTLNALSLSTLNLSALNLSALNLSALEPSTLESLQDPSSTGRLSRQLVRYASGCALDDTQSFSFSWTDSGGAVHEEIYKGHMGLAPSWLTGPLGETDARWISACLIARVNWYEESVQISMRGPHPQLASTEDPEEKQYAVREGAFWGNLFSDSPTAFACNHPPNIKAARSLKRDCAAGHVGVGGAEEECGMINIQGNCNTHCEALSSTGTYHPFCKSSLKEPATDVVITIWLQL